LTLFALSAALIGGMAPAAMASSKDKKDDDKSDKNKTKIEDIDNRTRNSVTLEVKNKKFDKEKVQIKVTIKNKATGVEENREFVTRLDGDGREKIFINRLAPNTEFSFKVKMREHAEGDFSDSDRESASTLA